MDRDSLGAEMIKPLVININGERKNIFAQRIKNKIWFHYEGETFCYEIPSREKRHREAKGHASPGVIHAPMPGKIIKVNKRKGDSVQAGEVVLVMEAMKMEYSLESDINGVVDVIHCNEDDQTMVGEVLAKIVENKE